jgi:hypothetical protein
MMTLENLLRIGKLKAHPHDERQVARLLESAARGAHDAALPDLSATSRLDLAWRAIMQAALAAMLANGYRPATSEPGHHQLLIHALPKTIGIAPERIPLLDAFRKARNQSDYGGTPISETVASECVQEARRVLEEVRAWLASRPGLHSR